MLLVYPLAPLLLIMIASTTPPESSVGAPDVEAGEPDDNPSPPTPRTGICGAVVAAKTGDALIEALVQVVKGASKSVRTDVDGKYALNLLPGEYDVRAQYELHRPKRIGGIVVRE